MSEFRFRDWPGARPELSLPCACPCVFCQCDPEDEPDPPAAPVLARSPLSRAAELARMGAELKEAKRQETEQEKRERWQEERKIRAREESTAWDWRPAGGADWIVQTHTLECERVGGYRVSRERCTCGDAAKRGDVVICKHRLGLQAKLERMMDQAFGKAA